MTALTLTMSESARINAIAAETGSAWREFFEHVPESIAGVVGVVWVWTDIEKQIEAIRGEDLDRYVARLGEIGDETREAVRSTLSAALARPYRGAFRVAVFDLREPVVFGGFELSLASTGGIS